MRIGEIWEPKIKFMNILKKICSESRFNEKEIEDALSDVKIMNFNEEAVCFCLNKGSSIEIKIHKKEFLEGYKKKWN